MLSIPTATQASALPCQVVMVTAVVYVAWYAAIAWLGAERTGLFKGLIPVASSVAVAIVGAGEITVPRIIGALAVLAGVMIGLTSTKIDKPSAVAPADADVVGSRWATPAVPATC
jgi:drug/metabolite transporter (DMT)-like permease